MGAFLTLSGFAAVILLVIHGGLCVDIIGGWEVAPHSRPFMAQIWESKFKCGGALIKENWVLTAAHCQTKKGKIILGAHSLKERGKRIQTFEIVKQIPYPCYNHNSKQNDIMLVQGYKLRELLVTSGGIDIVWSANPLTDCGPGDALLGKRATLNAAVKLIPLPTSDDDLKPGTICTVAGWGQTDSRFKKPSPTLREVNITVISRQVCNDKHHYNGKPVITENMICAGAKDGKKDSCDGDSGGPLRCKNVMRGITSFGKSKCGSVDGPGVYTRLTKQYLQWIRTTIGGA